MSCLFIAVGWIIVVAFGVTFVVTILGLVGKVHIRSNYLKWLFFKLILEIIAAGLFLFYSGIKCPADGPNLAGEWEYKCTKHGGGYEHGGVVTITQERTPYGLWLYISGRRDWIHNWDDKKDEVVGVDPPFSWSSTWGSITGKDEVRFTYVVTTEDGTVSGYACGCVGYDGERPSEIIGSFYQMPPFKPLNGGLDFRRVNDSTDRKWKPKSSASSRPLP